MTDQGRRPSSPRRRPPQRREQQSQQSTTSPRAERAAQAPQAPGTHERPKKPPLLLQPTTLWEYPSQHYGQEEQGDKRYVGATPSYVIWNLIQRYTQPGDLIVDPMCGSGTTLDVARDSSRRGRGFDLAPFRPE